MRNNVREALCDYLQDVIDKWNDEIKWMETGKFPYWGTLPSLPGDISYQEFIDAVKIVREDLKNVKENTKIECN